ncbi:MAG: M42 family peptidase [Thermoleophilia bacterium]|nr:M42 family peptidase [Thermoleophilia bacterium]GIK77075.1 MAG: endoglucanase [Actinomycetes bacterium]
MSGIPESLDALIRVPAPSGYETPAAEVWRDAASFGDVGADVLGSSTVSVGVAEDRPTVAVVGHIDEIGLFVSHVDDEGFLWFGPIGGWDPQNLVGQRVIVRGSGSGGGGEVPGVIGKKPIHLLEPDDRKKPAEIKSMHIDIGAKDRDEALTLVSVGDPAVLAAEPLLLPNGRLVSRSLDNRLGSYVALEVARRIGAGDEVAVGVVGCAVAQEEIGLFGSATTGFSLDPDVAIAVDVTHATDAPGISKQENGDHALGSGPVVGRGSTLSPKVSDLLRDAAEAEGIAFTFEASGRHTGTDADSLQVARGGIATGLVSIPLRYMHSSVETVSLDDVEGAIRLIEAFIRRLDPDESFVR